MKLPKTRFVVPAAVLLVVVVSVLGVLGRRVYSSVAHTTVTAYFANTNGLYEGDDVLLLGMPIGAIDSIEPLGDQVRVSLHYDASVEIPRDAKAVILSPSLVSSRAVQFTPAYTGGPVMSDGDRIDITRTAVPVEWDDFRGELQRLAESLEPTRDDPSGPLGSFVDSAANALNGKGDRINTTLTKLSEAMTTISDGRADLFSVLRDLQAFVSALASSEQQIVQFNGRLASVGQVLTNSDNELSAALTDVDAVAADLQRFVAANRDRLKHTVDGLTTVTTSLNESRPVLEQLLHVAPTAFGNFYNIYQPAQGALTGVLAVSQMQNPVQFICGAIQAASQLGAAESAKLCVQYLAPVLNSIQFNYPPVGVNPVTGVQAREDQVDYSEPFLDPQSAAPTPGTPVPAGSGLAGLMPRAGS
ncbi:MCE family protein [Nocardia jinanensis]|uniref:Mammalian cell entry protein n=1 Tax=Nocardia jinanensis TaxID=382504 RepID=A0A917RM81_9NOCA|nr:MCE family protein [Nocardia jinanensis]GGL15318.1 mammalian cell entry protein [Nocardia jinanensis]